MEKIRISFDKNNKIERINADCYLLEEKKEIDGEIKVIKYELYGYSEISDTIIGSCFMTAKTFEGIKYYIVNDNYEGKLPINLENEFENFFSPNKK